MAKFIKNNSGNLLEEATITTSAGAGDSGKVPNLNASGEIDITMLPSNIGSETASLVSAEALTAGEIVHITAAGLVELADATDISKPAMGFVLDTVAITTAVDVYFEGTNSSVSGLTPGAKQWLSAATPGAITTTAPSASGNIVQTVGRAHGATALSFEAAQYIELV